MMIHQTEGEKSETLIYIKKNLTKPTDLKSAQTRNKNQTTYIKLQQPNKKLSCRSQTQPPS